MGLTTFFPHCGHFILVDSPQLVMTYVLLMSFHSTSEMGILLGDLKAYPIEADSSFDNIR